MIPKIIHYCWFGGKPIPQDIAKYIKSWSLYCPNYIIKRWDESNFDLNKTNDFVKEAYKCKRFAFVSDYVRMKVLYDEGGVYMDTDIELIKNFDSLLEKYDFFTSIEYHEEYAKIQGSFRKLDKDFNRLKEYENIPGIGVQSAIFAASPQHPYIKKCMEFYECKKFILGDNIFFDKIILPDIMALCAEQFGFKYVNKTQILDKGIIFFPSDYFSDKKNITNNTISIHYGYNSWSIKSKRQRIYNKLSGYKILNRLLNSLGKNNYGRKAIFYIKKIIWK